jgi:hypothetical protein
MLFEKPPQYYGISQSAERRIKVKRNNWPVKRIKEGVLEVRRGRHRAPDGP